MAEQERGVAEEVQELIDKLEPATLAWFEKLKQKKEFPRFGSAAFQLYPEHAEEFRFSEADWESVQVNLHIMARDFHSNLDCLKTDLLLFPTRRKEIMALPKFQAVVAEMKQTLNVGVGSHYVPTMMLIEPEQSDHWRAEGLESASLGQYLRPDRRVDIILRESLNKAAHNILFDPTQQEGSQVWVKEHWSEIKARIEEKTKTKNFDEALAILAALQIIFSDNPTLNERGEVTFTQTPRLQKQQPLPDRLGV